MEDILTPEKRSWNMSRIKGKDTKPEVMLRSMLHKIGFRFLIHDKRLPGKPDITLPRYSTAIFVNGCFWHRHEKCKYAYNPKSRQNFWQDKFAKTVLRDQEKTEKLRQKGWRVLIVWECELEKNPQGVLEEIVANIKRCA